MNLNEDDIEFQHWPGKSQVGGQHVGISSGIICIHKPTGIAVIQEDERSMMQNRNKAIGILRGILLGYK